MGATLAELALPAAATPSQRRLFFAAGIVAANLPDADLVYTRITAPPLGYLLHHRGHTHTLAGLVALAALIGMFCVLPAVRSRIGTLRTRFATLIALALLSHLVLDAWNSYGVHPFWPVSNRWFYGDAIFIIEPWFWVFLGTGVAMNARTARARAIVGGLLAVLGLGLAYAGMVSVVVFVALAVGAFALVMAMARLGPHARAIAGLVAVAAFVNGMFVLRNVADARAVSSLARGRTTEVVDVVLNSGAGNPLCWSALAIAKDESAGEYAMVRGEVPVADGVTCGASERGRIAWDAPVRQSLVQLRALVQSDCWVRAWMQFGRAPQVIAGEVVDIRFSRGTRGNFTSMPVGQSGCPARITNWSFPRADLL